MPLFWRVLGESTQSKKPRAPRPFLPDQSFAFAKVIRRCRLGRRSVLRVFQLHGERAKTVQGLWGSTKSGLGIPPVFPRGARIEQKVSVRIASTGVELVKNRFAFFQLRAPFSSRARSSQVRRGEDSSAELARSHMDRAGAPLRDDERHSILQSTFVPFQAGDLAVAAIVLDSTRLGISRTLKAAFEGCFHLEKIERETRFLASSCSRWKQPSRAPPSLPRWLRWYSGSATFREYHGTHWVSLRPFPERKPVLADWALHATTPDYRPSLLRGRVHATTPSARCDSTFAEFSEPSRPASDVRQTETKINQTTRALHPRKLRISSPAPSDKSGRERHRHRTTGG